MFHAGFGQDGFDRFLQNNQGDFQSEILCPISIGRRQREWRQFLLPGMPTITLDLW
jgi:hypothetical protein